jgi:hypothetical protein
LYCCKAVNFIRCFFATLFLMQFRNFFLFASLQKNFGALIKMKLPPENRTKQNKLHLPRNYLLLPFSLHSLYRFILLGNTNFAKKHKISSNTKWRSVFQIYTWRPKL